VPVLKYFLTVGSLLVGLLYYASSVIEPTSLPFHIAQTSGLPQPYKAPAVEPPRPSVAVAEMPKAQTVAAKVELVAPVKNRKAANKRQSPQAVRARPEQERYAGYPPNDAGSIW
jgi:hypothetical protein